MSVVLIADDSGFIREDLKNCLESLGHQVVEAIDGSDGVQKFTEHREQIDLIFSDINMPKLDGLGMCRQIQEYCLKNPGKKMPPVLALTTETSLELKQEGKKLGVIAWLNKPFDRDTLKGVLDLVFKKFGIS